MKGDFSRDTFRREKHYSAVRQQQGRVQLDADWNEQADICASRDRAIAADVIGEYGAPEVGGGFAVSSGEDGDLGLSAGRLYVAGTLCELEAESSYLTQPDLPRADAISPAEGRTDLVYLDVWQRLITAVEDPEIREPALGGPDTATRAKTVWQARVLTDVGVSRCEEPIEGWPPPASDARLAATFQAGEGRGLVENALYRVEIHDPGPVGAATFKWSRDNGSRVFAVRELAPDSAGGQTEVSVEPTGRESLLALEEGDRIEALGDQSELMLTPGTMARVDRVDQSRLAVWLDGDLSSHASESHLKLRRWEGAGVLPVAERAVELEQGVEVQFSGGSFATGDYWMFPVRVTQPTTEWPASPPRGIRHDYCKLAVVTWRSGAGGAWTCEIEDCRPLFGSLTVERAGTCRRCQAEIDALRARLDGQARELRELQARLA